jgi:hypothetical protein
LPLRSLPALNSRITLETFRSALVGFFGTAIPRG